MTNLPINQILKVIYSKTQEHNYKCKVIFITNALDQFKITEVSELLITSFDVANSNELYYVATNGDWKDLSSYQEVDLNVYHKILQNGVLKNNK